MRDRSLIYNTQVPPYDMWNTPRAHQIDLLDRLHHVSEPDPESFIDTFYVQQGVEDCDRS